MIEEIMNKRMSRKEFINDVSIAIFIIAIFPGLIGYLIKEETAIKIKGTDVYLNDKKIIEVSDD